MCWKAIRISEGQWHKTVRISEGLLKLWRKNVNRYRYVPGSGFNTNNHPSKKLAFLQNAPDCVWMFLSNQHLMAFRDKVVTQPLVRDWNAVSASEANITWDTLFGSPEVTTKSTHCCYFPRAFCSAIFTAGCLIACTNQMYNRVWNSNLSLRAEI